MRKNVPSSFQSLQTDATKKYLCEGRRFEGVECSVLMQAWKVAGQLLVVQPTDHEVADAYQDLQSELELRGVEPQPGIARSEGQHFGKAIAEFFEEMKLDNPARCFDGSDQRTIEALKFLRAISAPAS